MKMKVFSINDICEIKSGKRIPLGFDFVDYKTPHPYIRARDIKNGNINTDDFIFLEENTYNKIKKYIINENDIAITIVGASIGDVGFAQKNVDGFNLTENAVRLTHFNDNASSKYVYYLLIQKQYKELMQTIAGGAAQPKLGIYKIQKIKVCLPSLHDQEKIASILSAYDNLIENNNKRIKILEQMAENLYKEWFVRFHFPGHETTPFENGIPKGWNYKRIYELYNTTSGGTPSRTNNSYYDNGNIPWVKTGELLDSLITDTEEFITEEGLKNSSAKMIEPGSLLCSMYAGVGKLGINIIPMTCSQATCVFTPKTDISIWYLFFWLKRNKEYLESISFGAAQQNISQDIIKKITVLFPTESVASVFDEKIKPIYQKIQNLMQQNANLIKQRDLLLPRLMSGKLAV